VLLHSQVIPDVVHRKFKTKRDCIALEHSFDGGFEK